MQRLTITPPPPSEQGVGAAYGALFYGEPVWPGTDALLPLPWHTPRVKRILAVVFTICLCLPAGATAYSFLPKEISEQEAMVYEYLYWDNYTMPMSVSHFHRYNATHTSCLVRWEYDGYLYFSRDYVSLHHGEFVVHPATFELWRNSP
jgi:hypothetical protein